MNPKILDLVPWDAGMPRTPQTFMIALGSILFLLSVWFVIVEHKRRKDWVPVYAFLGGGLIVIYEPLADILLSAFYPVHGAIGWIDLLGRPIPLFIGLNYFWYMSVPPIYFLKRLEQGLTTASFWRLWLLALIIADSVETLGVNLGCWYYYGPQPFFIFGVPLWAIFTYSGFLVTLCVGLHLMATGLDRRYHWMIILGMPLFMIAGSVSLTLPGAIAMLTTDNPVWIWLGGAASIALSLLLVYVVSLFYCIDGRRAMTIAKMGKSPETEKIANHA